MSTLALSSLVNVNVTLIIEVVVKVVKVRALQLCSMSAQQLSVLFIIHVAGEIIAERGPKVKSVQTLHYPMVL